ncbi:MAG: DUF5011 domain-containing protein [Ruminococcaceae bacterium]|nr:DUF5011 domain-containing protein [Oscillospiraceae bacterium]
MKKIIFIVLLALTLCFAFSCNESEPIPVIVGVKENVTVYADDSSDVIMNALLDGVTTEGGKQTEIVVKVFNKGTDTETSLFTAGEYDVRYTAKNKKVKAVTSSLTVKPADTTAPEFSGIKDLVVYLGDTVSYRDGVTVTDNDDENVTFTVDATKVDLTRLGAYEVTYSATDKRGNTASVTAKVSVLEPLEGGQDSSVCTKEELDALCQSILDSILEPGMTDRQKAEAIYDRVHKIKYVNTTDDPNWIGRAYTGLTTNKGDCVNYWAASKALLTMAGIPSYDIERLGGPDHYWQIVFIDGNWYHFDACPTLKTNQFRCFLRTDSEVATYSATRPDKPNYYAYDKENCPYDVVD